VILRLTAQGGDLRQRICHSALTVDDASELVRGNDADNLDACRQQERNVLQCVIHIIGHASSTGSLFANLHPRLTE
jgi:hypothetical protein